MMSRRRQAGSGRRDTGLLWLTAAVVIAIVLLGGHSWLWLRQIHAYDDLIQQVAADAGIDPDLVWVVAWRESRMNPSAVGGVGERGLMQVTEAVGWEWAAKHDVTDFEPDDLFDPERNLQVGTWYLARALKQWADRSDPVPYALAQYNAGRTHALRWAQDDEDDPQRFLEQITFPSTRAYIADVMSRHQQRTEGQK